MLAFSSEYASSALVLHFTCIPFTAAALTNRSKLVKGGAGWRRKTAHCGNSFSMCLATSQFANNMNSSIIELVSLSSFVSIPIGS